MDNDEIIKKLTAPATKEVIDLVKKGKNRVRYKIDSGISPYSLFLYFYSRFGKPNGLLSLFRTEDSDNLFHWDYTFCVDEYVINIMCATYKIEVDISKDIVSNKEECINFLSSCIKDLKNYKNKIKESKKNIENWEMIINPFFRMQKQINFLIEEINELNKELPKEYKHSHIDTVLNTKPLDQWINIVDRISEKVFSLRCLTPVYIETFINFIIEILCKKEIKNDDNLYQNVIRENINERIKSLHENCNGFTNTINRDNDIFKKTYTIFNQRNDLLHGNFIVKQLKYGDVHFLKNMPLFKHIPSVQAEIKTIAELNGKIENVYQNVDDAQMFMRYILLDLEDNIRLEVKGLLESSKLGWNKETNRFGILFQNNYVDYSVTYKKTVDKVKNIKKKKYIKRKKKW